MMFQSEEEYVEVVKNVILKPGGHTQKPQVEYPELTRIYAITTMAKAPRYGGERTPGICLSFERAKEIVENNEGDIYECSYQLVVVEALFADCLYGSSFLTERYWWVWRDITGADNTDDCYVAIEEPEKFKMTFGFGVG